MLSPSPPKSGHSDLCVLRRVLINAQNSSKNCSLRCVKYLTQRHGGNHANARRAGCELGCNQPLDTFCHLLGWPRMRFGYRSPCARRMLLVMWLALAFSVDLLCVSSTVLAHDIYSNLRDRDGHYCCNGQDCRHVQATVLPNGSYYLPTTNEIIPADRATPSPDDRFHQCTYFAVNYDFEPGSGSEAVWGEVTRCFFAPMHSS